jgi:hypothetical protein
MASHDVPRGTARRRRPWALIAASLLLALLSTILWAKWRDSRTRAERFQAELRQVYAEAEALRTEATRAKERIARLEQELRARPAPAAPKDANTTKPKTTR